MLKVMFVVHKHPDMSHEEFGEYWRVTHGAIARDVPGLRRYCQDHLNGDLPLGEPPCDGIAELWFDDLEALQTALATPEGEKAMADLANFTDTERTRPFVVEQLDIV